MENIQQESLFDQVDETGREVSVNYIEVVNSRYVGTQKVVWNDLFEGFDELYAITFSSGIDFTVKLLKYFEYAEIIYGCDKIVDFRVEAIAAMQSEIIEVLSKSKSINDIAERAANNSLRLYVSKDTKSHEKVFVLKAKDGRVRVITGSANMSASAFCGFQREDIIVYDDVDAFEYWYGRFNGYKEKCSNPIETSNLKKVAVKSDYLEDELGEIPFFKEIKERKESILIQEEEADETVFMANIKRKSDVIKETLPKKVMNKANIRMTVEDVTTIVRNNRKIREEKKTRYEYPRLHFDYDKGLLDFNGNQISLIPNKEDIQNDINCVINLLNGYNKFDGDYEEAQENYFAYLNWYFCTLFIPELRYVAQKHGYGYEYLPIFGMLCGQSNAGKTTVVKLCSKLMTGKTILQSGSDTFTATRINELRRLCEGTPIMIEDLAQAQYSANYEKVIKDENFGIDDHLIHYPAVSITANKIFSLTPDITKRVVYFRQNISTDKETAAKNAKQINDSINHASTALFGEWVRRMYPKVVEMETTMQSNVKDYAPDILKISSEVLVDIISEHVDVMPYYVNKLDYGSYFGDRVTGRTAISKIITAWRVQKDAFAIDRKNNTLSYTVPDQAQYELKYLKDELPSVLKADKIGSTLVMDLKAAKAFFGINFRKGLLWL